MNKNTTANAVKIMSVLDFPNSARWSSAKPFWNEGRGDTLKFVYESRGEFLAYSARGGYVGPFNTAEAARNSMLSA